MDGSNAQLQSRLERRFAPIHDPRVLRDLKWAFWLTLLALVLRTISLFVVPLIPEEAYYWMYGQNPQLSYFDHPPMVAWVIRAGVTIFGNNEFGVRVFATLLSLATPILMYRMARLWCDRRASLASAVLALILPVYFGMGFVAPMDAALCFYWVLCLLAISLAYRKHDVRWWYVAGIALGCALLSKYSGIFLAAGVFISAIATRIGRKQLRTIHPYLAGLVGIALFSPVVVWNAKHDWASFRFQFVDRYADDHFNLFTPPYFLSLQFVVMTPVLLAAFVWLVVRVARKRRALRDVVALSWAAPGLLAALWTSLRSDVHINWTAPIWLAVLPGICALMFAHDRLINRRAFAIDRQPTHRLKWQWMSATARTISVCGLLLSVGFVYLLVLQPSLQKISVFGPWRDVVAVVKEREQAMREETGRAPLVVGDGKYRLASVLAFYRSQPFDPARAAIHHTSSQWVFDNIGLGYEYWSTRAQWIGGDVIYVSEDDTIADIAPWFESVKRIEDPRLTRTRKKYFVAECHGLRSSSQSTRRSSRTHRTAADNAE